MEQQGSATEGRFGERARAALARWAEVAQFAGEKYSPPPARRSPRFRSAATASTTTLARVWRPSRRPSARAAATSSTRSPSRPDQLDKQLQRLGALMGESGDSVVDRIGENASGLGDKIARQVEAIDVLMSSRRDEIDQRLDTHHERMEGRPGAASPTSKAPPSRITARSTSRSPLMPAPSMPRSRRAWRVREFDRSNSQQAITKIGDQVRSLAEPRREALGDRGDGRRPRRRAGRRLALRNQEFADAIASSLRRRTRRPASACATSAPRSRGSPSESTMASPRAARR